MRFRLFASWAVLVALIFATGCSEQVDLQKALQLTDVTTGWYDAGIEQSPEGPKNKLVPTISFRLRNVGDSEISSVQINSIFRRVGEEDEWSSAWVRGIGYPGLTAGASTEPLTLRSQLGYLGLQPRAEMLQNKEFVDARVEIFAKHGSAQWVKLAEHRIERVLLTQ
ncbi:MAG: hypothetical protein ACE148_06555 [Vicinamibacterales bacterium]